MEGRWRSRERIKYGKGRRRDICQNVEVSGIEFENDELAVDT